MTATEKKRATISNRIDALDWPAIESSLWRYGFVRPAASVARRKRGPGLTLRDESRFRKRVDMAAHNFGIGEYKYFEYPLPAQVTELRSALFGHLARIASKLEQALGQAITFPDRLEQFLDECHKSGQTRPTPLLLRYNEEGYNCLHQDLYGEIWFPLQITAFLSKPSVDFDGGEFMLVEQRPRAQSIGEARSRCKVRS